MPKGAGKGPHPSGKGKTKDVDDKPAMGPPPLSTMAPTDPPWLSVNQSSPSTPFTSAPAMNSVDFKEDPKDKQIKTLLNALKKHNEELPPDVQALVQEATILSGQQETKQLHSAVAAHGKAKRELQEAQASRYNLHASWRQFLAQSAVQWQRYTDMFLQQQKQLEEKIAAAKEALISARESLSTSKVSAGVASKDDASMISDSEDLAPDAVEGNASKIAQGIEQLATNLRNLHEQAQQAEQEEQQALKRPRTVPPTETPEAPGPNSSTAFIGPA